ncbi:MAG: methionyl-tRNA formyltransferase [Candidatus Aminicenantales bacterium]
MRIVFFGSPASALPSLRKLLESGHSVECVVTQPDRPSGRGRKVAMSAVKAFAVEHGLPVLESERIRKDEAAADRLRAIQPDIQVVVAYGQIIPVSIIDLPLHRTLNVHFSLLPRYRGASPVQWAVLNGDARTGVTIIRLNAKMDEGDMLAARETDILAGETARDLEARLAEMGADLLLRTLEDIDRIVPVPQDHSRATLAPKIRKEDGLIDWGADAAAVDRKVRAFTPWPSAFTFLKGRRLQILRGRIRNGPPETGVPGTILDAGKSGLAVACGGRSVYEIATLQPEGRKEMDAHAFSLGTDVRRGDAFGNS